MSLVKEGQKSIRVVLPKPVYDRLKKHCLDHGDISRIIRRLLLKWLNAADSADMLGGTEDE